MMLYKQIAALLKGWSDTPEIDARLFCAFYNNSPTDEQIADFIERRQNEEPVAKIIGQKGFWKRDFYVSKDVLDPRPDSETLIEAVLQTIQDKSKSYRVLDIGTGSGCLILSLCDEYPNLTAVGVDKSFKALQMAQKNDVRHQVEWLQKDFFHTSFAADLGVFDIVVSNPPYIPTADIPLLEKSVSFDPVLALDGGDEGLDCYEAIAKQLAGLTHSNSLVFFEIGQGQEEDIEGIMRVHGWQMLNQYKDLGGIVRVLSFKREG